MPRFPLSGQVGLIQLGQEQVLIQPLNNSRGLHSEREHLIRRKWSSTPSPSTEARIRGQRCKVLTGEAGTQHGCQHTPCGTFACLLAHPY